MTWAGSSNLRIELVVLTSGFDWWFWLEWVGLNWQFGLVVWIGGVSVVV